MKMTKNFYAVNLGLQEQFQIARPCRIRKEGFAAIVRSVTNPRNHADYIQYVDGTTEPIENFVYDGDYRALENSPQEELIESYTRITNSDRN